MAYSQQEECIQLCEVNADNGKIGIAWRNLQCEVGEFTGRSLKKKPILRRLNGHFVANSLNGLMGPSGAGKTTLLNVLNGNARSGICSTSEIYLNSTSTSQVSYFIEQHVHENIVGQMSVGQVLRYAFRFKNGLGYSLDSMNKHIEQTMRELMLPADLLDRPFRRCSGGEQKRVAICQELMSLTKPSFLFLDEPTTGLDSAAALQVVQCLQQLTAQHRITVIISIHAPNHDILSLLDHLCVLSKSGLCIYSGHPSGIQSNLEKELQLSIPDDQPPIEALIKIACDYLDSSNTIKLATHCQICEFAKLTPHLSHLKPIPSGLASPRKPFTLCGLFTHISRQFHITFISNYRQYLIQIVFHIVNILWLAAMFNNDMALPSGCYSVQNNMSHDINCQVELQQSAKLNENINYHVFCCAIVGFVITCTNTLLFSSMIKVFRNEYRNRWYSLGAFYTSTNLIALLELSTYVITISTVAYLATSQHAIDNYTINWNRFGQFTLAIWLLCLYTQSLGQMIGALVMQSTVLAVVLSIMIYMVMDIMNDFLFKTDEFRNELLVRGSDLVGLKFVTKYTIYVFYGIDRCHSERQEFSWVLPKHYVREDDVGFYIRRILQNSALMRLTTFAALYCKFNWFTFMKHLHEKKSAKFDINEPIPIELNKSEVIEVKECQNDGKVKGSKTKGIISGDDSKVSIAWRNLSLNAEMGWFNLEPKSKDRLILCELNGEFRFGTLNALMGTSGAGKTSLLRVLNGQCKTRIGDSTRFYLSKFTKITTCFITQEVSGHLMPGLTAKQMLVYASRLKNANEDVDHEAIAIGLLNELDLANTESTRVERCSGGERKRLALALELTSRQMPNLVCIDEPTSGLDSNSAEIVISCLRKLTHAHNLTIIASIHQPNTEILAMFDQLYVLARGGVCIYSGPPSQIQAHLNSIPQMGPTESKYAIEELIKLSCGDHTNELVQCLVEHANNKFDDPAIIDETNPVSALNFDYGRNFSTKSTYILALRHYALFRGHLWKEWLLFYAIILSYSCSLHIFWSSDIALTSGCLAVERDFLYGTCDRSEQRTKQDKDIDDSLKYNFFMNNIFLLLILLQSSLTLFKEIQYFYNEHRNGWYSSGSFYLMKSLTEIVPLLPIILVYLYISDIFSAVRPPGIYQHFLLLILLAVFASQGMAHLIVLLSNGNITIITLIFMFVYDIFLLLSNFFVNVNRLTVAYRALANFSISKWTYEAALLLEYGFGRCRPQVEVHPVLNWLQLTDEDYAYSIVMLLINCVVFRIVSFALIWLKTNSTIYAKCKIFLLNL